MTQVLPTVSESTLQLLNDAAYMSSEEVFDIHAWKQKVSQENPVLFKVMESASKRYMPNDPDTLLSAFMLVYMALDTELVRH